MSRGESPAPSRQPGLPGDRRCESAREELALMLSAGGVLADEPNLREHLGRCADCNAIYRSSLLIETRLRRAMIDADASASSPEPPRPRAVLSPLSVTRAGWGSSGGGKALWVIGLAVIGYASMRLTTQPAGASRAELQALAGSVVSLGVPLEVGSAPRELQRGDWLRTGEEGRARLTLGTTEIEIAASSEVQIEEPKSRRVRLESGALAVNGALFVTSPFGVVEVQSGRATLRIEESTLMIESSEGNVRACDARGERTLIPGESMHFARSGQ